MNRYPRPRRRSTGVPVLLVAAATAVTLSCSSETTDGEARTTPAPTTPRTTATSAGSADTAGTNTTSTTRPTTTRPAASTGTAGTATSGSAPRSTVEPAGSGYRSAITDSPVDNPALRPLVRTIDQRTSRAGLPGASLLVLHDGKLVEQVTMGDYTLDTQVPIASASKWLSGAVIMSLVDEGLLDLDAPIGDYLQDLSPPQADITLRQLLNFTSAVQFDDKIPCYDDLSVTLAECNSIIGNLPLLDRPGTGFRYTGTHLHLAAGLAESVTGKTFEALFQDRIAAPLGMEHTTFTFRTGQDGVAADGHPRPAGSAVSTLGDYGRFLEMLVHDGVAPDGTQVLSPEAVAEMGRVQTRGTRFVSGAANRRKAKTPYGLAHWIDTPAADGTAVVESSPGKFGFRPWIDHANDIAAVYMIVDKDDSHVADSPDAVTLNRGALTSGQYLVDDVAEALGLSPPRAG